MPFSFDICLRFISVSPSRLEYKGEITAHIPLYERR
jgi:hypothetical protein